MVVIDPSAVAQLVTQIQKALEMIRQLQTINKGLESLNEWEIIDHTNLASKKFRRFFEEYKQIFEDIMKEIEGYHEGGLMGQLERLDEVYWQYHTDWDKDELFKESIERDPLYGRIAKEVLWTRIQFKHAAKVGSQIRESLKQSQSQVQVLLDDTAQAVGIMQSIKIGNQLTGMVAKSLDKLNVSLTEHLQAQAAQGLELNQKQGLQMNRAREAIKGWGTPSPSKPLKSANPFDGF
jgi:conjugal transfer/entry exclusion protein